MQPYWMTYIGADDVDATVEKAKGMGANVAMEPSDVPSVGRLAILVDPTGAVFGLYCRSSPSRVAAERERGPAPPPSARVFSRSTWRPSRVPGPAPGR